MRLCDVFVGPSWSHLPEPQLAVGTKTLVNACNTFGVLIMQGQASLFCLALCVLLGNKRQGGEERGGISEVSES